MTQNKIEKLFAHGVIACLGLVLFLSLGCENSGGIPVDRPRQSAFAPSPNAPGTKEQLRKLKYQIIENKSRIDQLESEKLDVCIGFGLYESCSELDKAKMIDELDDEIDRLSNENDKLNDEIVKLGGEPYLLL